MHIYISCFELLSTISYRRNSADLTYHTVECVLIFFFFSILNNNFLFTFLLLIKKAGILAPSGKVNSEDRRLSFTLWEASLYLFDTHQLSLTPKKLVRWLQSLWEYMCIPRKQAKCQLFSQNSTLEKFPQFKVMVLVL